MGVVAIVMAMSVRVGHGLVAMNVRVSSGEQDDQRSSNHHRSKKLDQENRFPEEPPRGP